MSQKGNSMSNLKKDSGSDGKKAKSSSSHSDSHYDTIVVGAGIIGSGIGHQLAQMYGKRVLILEQGEQGHKDGSSHGGSRILRHTHTDALWLPMAMDAYREWTELESKHHEPILKTNGVITLDFEEEMTAKRHRILAEAGIAHKVLRGEEITAEFGHLQNYAQGGWSAIYEPSGVTLLADKCLQAIQEQFKKRGEIKFQEKVTNWGVQEAKEQIWVETSKSHRYTAENVVFAVGGWLPKLFPQLPVKSEPFLKGSLYWDVEAEKKEFFNPNFRRKDGHDHHQHDTPNHQSPSLCIWPSRKDEESMYAIPESRDKFKFCTSYGIKIEGEIKQSGKRGGIPEKTISGPKAHIKEHLPWVNAEKPAKTSETCITTVTSDGKWIVDEHPQYAKRVYIAGGFCGTGFKYALTVGKLLAQKMAGIKSPQLGEGKDGGVVDMDQWSLDLAKRKGRKLVVVAAAENEP